MSLQFIFYCLLLSHIMFVLKVIVRLACNLDRVKEPAARALIIWIIGEYCSVGQIIPRILPSVLKYLAWTFNSEELETKLQTLNTAAKVPLCIILLCISSLK